MTDTLLVVLIALVLAAIGLVVFLLKKVSNNSFDQAKAELEAKLKELEKVQEKSEALLERTIKDEISRNREETTASAHKNREEMRLSFKSFTDSFLKQLDSLSQNNSQRLERMRETVEGRLQFLQQDNNKKLEEMRVTVDEKLHSTLEKRLGESFKLVSERLELVHKGLGEMQTLASGVGDLKKVLSNVKTRGTWGEIQLGNLLEQVLTPDQFAKNVQIKTNSSERVDFAIKLPGKEEGAKAVWLPIDAKFPQEDYQRLVEAQENANPELANDAIKQLENRIKFEAKSIKEKYIDPPNTTDFAILFLPIEGLYAEVLRRPGLSETLQKDFRIVIAGPTTLAALLNSLQMGFRTLAIEKRSSEVWGLLGVVKSEFGKFGDILEKTQKKLQEAGNTIETAARKTRTIERKLKNVEELPINSSKKLLTDSEFLPNVKESELN